MKRNAARALLLLFAAAAGCSRCGSKSAATAEELLPQTTTLAASTGTLGALALHGAALVERAAAVPGGEQLGDLRKQLAAQLGFDPLTREGLLSAGLDPDRSAAVSASLPEGAAGRPAWVVAAPLTNPELFAAAMDKLLGQRAGYPLRSEEAREEVKVVTFARSRAPELAGQRVAYAIVRGYSLLARGLDPASAIAAAVKRPREQTLLGDPAYSDARAQLKGSEGGVDLLVFKPAGSDLGRRFALPPPPGETSLLLSFSKSGLTARGRLALPPDQRERLATVLPGGGAPLLSLLLPAAPLQARLGLSPAEVASLLERAPVLKDLLPALRRELADRKIDLDQDLFGSLQPGIVFSAASSPALELSRAVDLGFLDWRAHSPFEFVQVAALAEVAASKKDRLVLALDALAQAMPKIGAAAVRSGDDWQVTYAGGAGARFGVRESAGKTIAYLLGGGLAPERLAPQPGTPEAILSGPAGAAVSLDLGKLESALRALPESTYGSGPQSYIARSIVDRVVAPFKLLRLSLSVAPTAQGVEATATLQIAPEPAPPAPKP